MGKKEEERLVIVYQNGGKIEPEKKMFSIIWD
jgi:hypothetical protein